MYYSRSGDYCKGMNRYTWGFLCALGEAQYLNTTFVEGKDFRLYFDFEHLKEEASIVEEREFLRDWKRWDKNHKRKIPVRKVASYKTTPMQLKKERSTVTRR